MLLHQLFDTHKAYNGTITFDNYCITCVIRIKYDLRFVN